MLGFSFIPQDFGLNLLHQFNLLYLFPKKRCLFLKDEYQLTVFKKENIIDIIFSVSW